MYLDANNQYGWPMSQKLPVYGFEWVKKLSKFDEHFIKNRKSKNVISLFMTFMTRKTM